ncbi:MAG: helix-turn-helix domain-containing protein, partial [Gammaproteobacteria bacterium]|nr:helix-turn-helix domain-containing protein [Gammaproteobacteria bacterium]
MQNTPEAQAPSPRLAAGAGATLRAAREAAGIEVDALARRIRLEPKVLVALESEAWERLAGPAFIKGYIRSVARELGIDPAAALAQYAAQADLAAPTLADFESRAPLELTSANRWIKAVSYALVAVLLTLVAVWWQRNYESSVAPPSAEDAALEAAAANLAEPSPPVPESDAEESAPPLIATENGPPAPISAPPAALNEPGSGPSEPTLAPAILATTAPATTPPSTTAPATTPPSTTAPATTPPST